MSLTVSEAAWAVVPLPASTIECKECAVWFQGYMRSTHIQNCISYAVHLCEAQADGFLYHVESGRLIGLGMSCIFVKYLATSGVAIACAPSRPLPTANQQSTANQMSKLAYNNLPTGNICSAYAQPAYGCGVAAKEWAASLSQCK